LHTQSSRFIGKVVDGAEQELATRGRRQRLRLESPPPHNFTPSRRSLSPQAQFASDVVCQKYQNSTSSLVHRKLFTANWFTANSVTTRNSHGH
jgi:hypothetical protein